MFEIACKLKIQLSALEVLLRDFLAAGAREGEQFLHTVSPYSPSALQNMQHFCLHFMQRCDVVEQRQLERGEERGEERAERLIPNNPHVDGVLWFVWSPDYSVSSLFLIVR